MEKTRKRTTKLSKAAIAKDNHHKFYGLGVNLEVLFSDQFERFYRLFKLRGPERSTAKTAFETPVSVDKVDWRRIVKEELVREGWIVTKDGGLEPPEKG